MTVLTIYGLIGKISESKERKISFCTKDAVRCLYLLIYLEIYRKKISFYTKTVTQGKYLLILKKKKKIQIWDFLIIINVCKMVCAAKNYNFNNLPKCIRDFEICKYNWSFENFNAIY